MFAYRACWAVAGYAAMVAVTWSGAADAQTAFSDRVIQQIEEAREAATASNFEAALALYNRALAAATADRSDHLRGILVNRAALLEQLQKHADAEADLTTALAVQPVDPGIYADRGYFYIRRQRLPDALSDFLQGARLAPNQSKYLLGAGRVQAALENFPGAILFYNDAIAADPSGARSYLARAEAQVRLGRWADARADYDSAVQIGLARRLDDYFARLGRGYVHLVMGQYDPAIADLDAALAFDPTAVKALMWRGYANERRGRPDLAIADYERAVAANRGDPVARLNRDRLRSRHSFNRAALRPDARPLQ